MRWNPYQSPQDCEIQHGPYVYPRSRRWLPVHFLSAMCRLLSGINFLLLPFAVLGWLLRLDACLRGRTANVASATYFAESPEIVILPFTMALGGIYAARASVRWSNGWIWPATLDTLLSIGLTVTPWMIRQ